jgi:hypothetical protein
MLDWSRRVFSVADPNGTLIWCTKGFSFWALLSAILIKTRPNSILELGGGRSTTFLADYAFRFQKEGMTIEESKLWQRKITADLEFMDLRGYSVHLAPLTTDTEPPWYDFDVVESLIGGRTFDLVFVDGPARMSHRCNARGQNIVRGAARDARLDHLRRRTRATRPRLLLRADEPIPANGKFFYHYGSNVIAIAGAGRVGPHDRRVASPFLGMDYTHSMPPVPPHPKEWAAAVDNRGWAHRLWNALGRS